MYFSNLAHWGLGCQICVSQLGHHWFGSWLDTWSALNFNVRDININTWFDSISIYLRIHRKFNKLFSLITQSMSPWEYGGYEKDGQPPRVLCKSCWYWHQTRIGIVNSHSVQSFPVAYVTILQAEWIVIIGQIFCMTQIYDHHVLFQENRSESYLVFLYLEMLSAISKRVWS